MINKRVVVLTSGGDSPCMNATIYAFVVAAELEGVSVYGCIDGYRGLIDGNFKELKGSLIRNFATESGTLIGSSRCLEFKDSKSAREKAVRNLKSGSFDALLVIGGDGSYRGAELVSKLEFPVIAVPGTIDNDVVSTKYTVGFFSALEEIFYAIKKIRATSESHSQITFLEVMGRDCSDLSVCAAVAGIPDYLITNKNPVTPEELLSILSEMIKAGKRGIVILVSEKIYGEKFNFNLPSLSEVCKFLESKLKRQVRASVLGYVQRGSSPCAWDLYVASGFGRKAFSLMKSGDFNLTIGFDGNSYYTTPISEALELNKEALLEDISFVNSMYKIYTRGN